MRDVGNFTKQLYEKFNKKLHCTRFRNSRNLK